LYFSHLGKYIIYLQGVIYIDMEKPYISTELKGLIEKCLENDRKCQNTFYEHYSTKVFGVCLRYSKNFADAEDILQEGFIKAFKYLKDYSGKGSLEAWMGKIMVTTALNYYKKKNLINKDIDPESSNTYISQDNLVVSRISHAEIIALLHELPFGYQTVFKLRTIEGYSHKEISKIMQISINTSKSQLSRANKALRKKIESIIVSEDSLLSISELA
jgi:RNA polymerase sigma factor (sigma-70 family)